VDTSDTGLTFKEAVYGCTGVPTGESRMYALGMLTVSDRMKVMVKGGMLKVVIMCGVDG
jgi:hypothetical protein